ncbi:hypothetical protein MNBD_PLANCTO02-1776, partial [hydrothermal vent metagenome]
HAVHLARDNGKKNQPDDLPQFLLQVDHYTQPLPMALGWSEVLPLKREIVVAVLASLNFSNNQSQS